MPGGNKNIRPEDGRQFQKGDKAAEKWTEELALTFSTDMLKWMSEADENIFFDDFIFLSCDEKKYFPAKINADTPAYLSKKFSSFFDHYTKAKEIQKIKLKKFGAFDKLNARIVTFLLSAEYGMSEKKENNTNLKVTGIKPIEWVKGKDVEDK